MPNASCSAIRPCRIDRKADHKLAGTRRNRWFQPSTNELKALIFRCPDHVATGLPSLTADCLIAAAAQPVWSTTAPARASRRYIQNAAAGTETTGRADCRSKPGPAAPKRLRRGVEDR